MATKSKKVIPHYPAELKEKLCRLVAEGRTPEDLSGEFGPSAQSIRNWVNAAGRKTEVVSDITQLKQEVTRLRKIAQARTLEVQALRVLLEETRPEFSREIPVSPFEQIGTPTE